MIVNEGGMVDCDAEMTGLAIREIAHIKPYTNKQWLNEKYIEDELSSYKIARMCGCSHRTILNWLEKHDIEKRDCRRRPNHINISKQLNEILIGELLGDGCVLRRPSSAWYQHTTKYKSYLRWLFGLFKLHQLDWNGKLYEVISPWSVGYFAKTYQYYELIELRQKFYPEGIKILPKDIVIAPTILRHWYLGDGFFIHKTGLTIGLITLCTNCFTIEDVKRLKEIFLSIGIKAGIHKNSTTGFEIQIGKASSVIRFFEYIGKCPEAIRDIYGYKFPKEVFENGR